MTMIEDTRYKKLMAQERIAKLEDLLTKLEMASASSNEKPSKEPISIEREITLLNELLVENEGELIDLDDPQDYVYSEIYLENLKTSYPAETENLKKFEANIKNTPNTPPNKSVIVTLMEIFSKDDRFDRDELDRMRKMIAKALTRLNYDRNSETRVYLSTKMPHIWYKYYMFENPTVPTEEHTYLLNEFLANVSSRARVMSIWDKKTVIEHMSCEGCTIDIETVVSLLAKKLLRDNEAYQMIHPFIEPCDTFECLAKLFSKKLATPSFGELKRAFDELFFISPIKEWIEDFAALLVQTDDDEQMADVLLEYIETVYSRKNSILFEDAFVMFSEELKEQRKNLVFVLKAIQKDKSA